jgi:NADH-quinone oxidoreductase subunit L
MGGFRRAMPFTFATFTIGALALAAVPPFAGLFSKDAILAFDLHRGGLYAVLAVFGYVAAGLTAFYAFRMVFRVFWGDPVPEAQSLIDHDEIAHGEHRNPATGEEEDTDVGFPGSDHHIAEHDLPMRAAMAPLALLSIIAGVVLVPGATRWIDNFLEPSFEDSRFAGNLPSTGDEWSGLVIGGLLAILGVAVAWQVFVRRRGLTLELRDRVPGLHRFLDRKWYFDEAYDALFVRPMASFGRFGRFVFESAFVQGVLIGGASGIVRTGTSFARTIQAGYLRGYVLLLMIGLGALGLYFLLQAS